MTHDRQTCPTCQTDTVVPVVYGFPTDDTFEASRRGEVALGGCVIIDAPWEHRGQRELRCTTCGRTMWVERARNGSGGGATEEPA